MEAEEETITSVDQRRVENEVTAIFQAFIFASDREHAAVATLHREKHAKFLTKALMHIPRSFSGLDAARPWFCFWISHSLELIGELDVDFFAPRAASFLSCCQDPNGGFAGGPRQLPHLAPTYAAVAALAIAGTAALSIIDRRKMYDFLMRLKGPRGCFRMHDNGEMDMRGTYCAIAVASMLRLITPELTENVAEYVLSCQNWEGGIAGEEDLEAHGGYGYCGLASVAIIGEESKLDLRRFLHWAVHRQMSLEGGFQGRTNKLVDSCYSFWQGAVFPILHDALKLQGVSVPDDHFWIESEPLQMYVLLACQQQDGGLRDKPGKSPDFYHSCYALSGLAVAQRKPGQHQSEQNALTRTDIFYNIGLSKSEGLDVFDREDMQILIDGVRATEGAGARRWRKELLENMRATAH